MAHARRNRNTRTPGRTWRYCAAALALGLYGCNDDSSRVEPVGRLVQQTLRGPISYTSAEGWRVAIENRAISIRPPEDQSALSTQYVSAAMREQLGTQDVRAWAGDRRSILLPGGAKITLHGQGGQLIRLSIHDGDESHEVDVLTQTLMHSRVDAANARSRDAAEHDGETAHLIGMSASNGIGMPVTWSLYLANLYVQDAGTNGLPVKERVAALPLARQVGDAVHVYADPGPVFPVETEASCDVTPQPRGGLVQQPNGTFEYASRSGRWKVRVDQHTITATRSLGSTYQWKWEVWGDPHENLNGKHIGDWNGTRRTLLLDDGTKITMDAAGAQGVVLTTSIYDGAQSHEIGNVGNVLRHSCVHAQTTTQREGAELDGETAHLAILRSPASVAGGLFVEQIYTETTEAGQSVRTFDPELLGETGEADINSNQVRDYYDDPRLGHT
jgi:hypothetical protein